MLVKFCRFVSDIIFACSFETRRGEATMCAMQGEIDAFDWTLRRGPTPSFGTGPDAAVSGQLYAHIEATVEKNRNMWARYGI